jgi:hypothetical protein
MTTPACPCEIFVHPLPVSNPPGRAAIASRVGDYTQFRHALLVSRPGETELANWRPSAEGDLALQMMEWWAYLADILTFYNERVANEDYLRTAVLPESVRRLIRILGYRPRPGIAATVTLAALLSGRKPITLSAGFQIQSKPGPGKQPQIFELAGDTPVNIPDSLSVDPSPDPHLYSNGGVLLQGSVNTVKAGDSLLLLDRAWPSTGTHFFVVTASGIKQEADPRGANNTRVLFADPGLPAGALAANYRLLKYDSTSRPWQYGTGTGFDAVGANSVHLDSITRSIEPGDLLLFDASGSGGSFSTIVSKHPIHGVIFSKASQFSKILSSEIEIDEVFQFEAALSPELVRATSYSEIVWYANPDSPALNPNLPPATPPAVSIPHSLIGFSPALTGKWEANLNTTRVRHGFRDVGVLIGTRPTVFDGSNPILLLNSSVPPALVGASLSALIEDVNGNGEPADVVPDPPQLTAGNLPDHPPVLTAPLRVLLNTITASRGKSVTNEILGSGAANVADQEFVLAKSPLTYLQNGAGYKSTLQVFVDNVQWKEVASFYAQPPDAHIFVTREDDQQMTHVQFGDGLNGARLSSGTNNVVAFYRYGSGADAPDAGTLGTIVKPWPGLKEIRNPVAAAGGADPDPPAQIRRYAPQSVLNFGRAISGNDYETIAAQTPGVARAKAYWGFDADLERTAVRVYVGDTPQAKINATVALQQSDDPNRPVNVISALPVRFLLELTVRIDAIHLPDPVLAAVRAALLDPDTGLFGTNVIQIGQSIWESQIDAACLSVAGTLAVHEMQVRADFGSQPIPLAGPRFDPTQGGFFQLADADLNLHTEIANAG